LVNPAYDENTNVVTINEEIEEEEEEKVNIFN
jgi:hypothetical protein